MCEGFPSRPPAELGGRERWHFSAGQPGAQHRPRARSGNGGSASGSSPNGRIASGEAFRPEHQRLDRAALGVHHPVEPLLRAPAGQVTRGGEDLARQGRRLLDARLLKGLAQVSSGRGGSGVVSGRGVAAATWGVPRNPPCGCRQHFTSTPASGSARRSYRVTIEKLALEIMTP